jgi:general stress protein 26
MTNRSDIHANDEAGTGDDARAKVFELLKDIRVAMMASKAPDGTWHARPMATAQARPEGELWFFTDLHSPKVDEIGREPRVLLTFADESGQTYVSISGEAEVVRDTAKARELWSEAARVWFPRGAEDPALGLVRVSVDTAEYWDSPSSTMVMAYGYLKAVTTGRRPNPGDTAKVTF